jgi:hypothetical protein
MTGLEERLRVALQEKADRIPADAPPLRLEAVADSISSRQVHGPRARPKWLAPVAASVAVLIVAIAAVITSGVFGGGKTSSITVPASAMRGIPRYYVTLQVPNGRLKPPPHAEAQVRATRTGAVIAKITPPHPYVGFDPYVVAGAANDRTFVLAAQNGGLYGTDQKKFPSYQLFLLYINPGARSPGARVRLTPLAPPFPVHFSAIAMALSPDGKSLAIFSANLRGRQKSLTVYNLTKGTSRTWPFTVPDAGAPWKFGTLSWASNGRVGFVDLHHWDELRLLDPTAGGAGLTAGSQVIRLRGVPYGLPQLALFTADGRSVFIGLQTGRWQEELLRFSVRTRKVTAVLNNMQRPRADPGEGKYDNWEQVLWMNSSGSKLIITNLRRGATAGIVRGQSYTAIPWSRETSLAAW